MQYFLHISGIWCWGNRRWDSRYVHWWSHCRIRPSASRSCTSTCLGKWRDRLQRQRQVWEHPEKNWGVYWGVEGSHRYARVPVVLSNIIIIEWAVLFQQKCSLGFQGPVNKVIMNLMRQVKGYKQAHREWMHIQIMMFEIQLWENGGGEEKREAILPKE